MEELMWTVLVSLTAINLLVSVTIATQAKIALFFSKIALSMLTHPLFLEPFWMRKAEESAVVESGWHRMSYRYYKLGAFVSVELEMIIRELHSIMGNAVTDNRFIVFGTGATQLIAASVHALSQTNSSYPSRLVTSVPYYNMYKQQAEFFNSADLMFEGDASAWKQCDNITQVIEIVTSPNNPDGKLKCAVLDGPNVKTIHDCAYYWPYFSPIIQPVDEDLSLFSLSKTTGHAGSRFGWALVKDEAVYKKMNTYISLSTMGVSRDTQLHALQLLKVVIGDRGDEIFHFGYRTMKKRWEKLNKIMSMSTRFSLETIKPEYCNYFKKVRDFTPSYAWVKCERLEDTNCYEIFKAAKITGRGGEAFGSGRRFVRLSLIRSQDDFDQLIAMLKKFVSKEAVVVVESI
ncbi:tryptophan aminotransferase-related protein 3 isoform X2 [Capsella rubella]|uniref:tryptophan aminotransferase-related protein 3 isoform X2 n=1 Tax=Capsella rubella TaxID=81985 RepID=UPI000CD4D889|nr:tryptophan aminotransferase-related protein 3 isoform X2 [Capsella rubella]